MENPTTQKKLPKLTKQDEDFVTKVVLTGKLTKSAKEAYNLENDRYATQKAQRQIAKDSIIEAINVKQETLKSALEKKGITPEKIADKINVLLDAEDKEGKKDYIAIDKGLKHAKEIYGVESSEDKPKNNTTYNFIFNTETQEKIKELNEAIKSKLIGND